MDTVLQILPKGDVQRAYVFLGFLFLVSSLSLGISEPLSSALVFLVLASFHIIIAYAVQEKFLRWLSVCELVVILSLLLDQVVQHADT